MKNEAADVLNALTIGRLPELPDDFAIGNDLVFLPDFEQSCTSLFRSKVYTAAEMTYCERFTDSLQYASTWAAKEAVYKAVKQVDSQAMGWKDIEIIREKISGRPVVHLHRHPGKFNISLTITHDGDYVWAIALLKIA